MRREGVERDAPPYFLMPKRLPMLLRPFFELPPPRLVAVLTCMRPAFGGRIAVHESASAREVCVRR